MQERDQRGVMQGGPWLRLHLLKRQAAGTFTFAGHLVHQTAANHADAEGREVGSRGGGGGGLAHG